MGGNFEFSFGSWKRLKFRGPTSWKRAKEDRFWDGFQPGSVAEYRPGCLLLPKLILQRQVLM